MPSGPSSPTSCTALMHESFIFPFFTASIVILIDDTAFPTGTSTYSRSDGGATFFAAPPSRLIASDVI